ncbi:Dolichyldiphosphatase 1, partial [Globisporangium splendens]
MVMYATLVVFQRDLDIVVMLIGQLLNEVVNQILKRSIQQSRPEGARMSGSGMPSAHSQFIFFFAAYVVAYTWKRFNAHRRLEQSLTIVGATVLAVVVCVSRIRLGYHSKEQVVVGALVGALTGLAWHGLVTKTSPWLFPLITETALAQFFYIRDISRIPDLIVYQHQLCHGPSGAKQD